MALSSFSPGLLQRRIVPYNSARSAARGFVAGFLSAQFFLLVSCVTGIVRAAKNEDCDDMRNAELFPEHAFTPQCIGARGMSPASDSS